MNIDSKPPVRRGRKKKKVQHVSFTCESLDMTLGFPAADQESGETDDSARAHQGTHVSFGGLEIRVLTDSRAPDTVLEGPEVTKSPVPDAAPPREYNNNRNKVTNREMHKSRFMHHCSQAPGLSNVYVSVGEDKLLTPIRPENPTNVCCWWCCHTFDNEPCYLPTMDDPLTQRIVFVGNFCSWQCVKAYNFSIRDAHYATRSNIMRNIFRAVGLQGSQIKSAPPRETLKMFGGPLSIDEFRNPNVPTFRLLSSQVKGKTIFLETVTARRLTR